MDEQQLFPVHSGSVVVSGCCSGCRRAGFRCPGCGVEIIRQVPAGHDLPSVCHCRCESCEAVVQLNVVGWWHSNPLTDGPGSTLIDHLHRSWRAKPGGRRPNTGGQSNG